MEFHPVVWMFDDDFQTVAYNYFNDGPIVETSDGTYADLNAPITNETVTWNHHMGEVVSALLQNKIQIEKFEEYDYSPYNCFRHTEQIETGKFIIKHFGKRIPMVYGLVGRK